MPLCAALSSFLPGLDTLQIDPAIPSDFVIASSSKPQNISQEVYWGKKETLERYFRGEVPLKSPIIVVKLSNNVVQDGPNSFHTDAAVSRELKCLGRSKLKIRKISWGNHPVLTLDAVSQSGTHYYMAWVGLNLPEGKTALFTFLCPNSKNIPDEQELALWKHFLSNSSLIDKGKMDRQKK